MEDDEDNKHIENIASSLTNHEINELKNTLNYNNNKFVISWLHIINCVNHEMWNKLGSSIKSIIFDNNNNDDINLNDKSSKSVQNPCLY